MKVRKEWIGSKKAATQSNLAELQEDIHADLQELATKDDFKGLRKDMVRLQSTQESMLKVLESIEGRLKDMANHETRIQRLEKEVLFAKH